MEGSLPKSLLNCESLEVLDVGDNKLEDAFPYWLESLPMLQVLVLKSNRFYGNIVEPNIKFPFQKLRIIDLSNNYFTSLLPEKYFENFKAMRDAYNNTKRYYMGEVYYEDSVTATMKGQGVELVKILTIFTTIDLSRNSFNGEIPNIIGKLKSLKGVNLSHNQLSGSIPSFLGSLTDLEWLDFSSNELKIPQKLSGMTSLEIFYLSYNNLEGVIPHENDTFDNNCYNGKQELCGFPLSKFCNNEVLQQEVVYTSQVGLIGRLYSQGMHVDWYLEYLWVI